MFQVYWVASFRTFNLWGLSKWCAWCICLLWGAGEGDEWWQCQRTFGGLTWSYLRDLWDEDREAGPRGKKKTLQTTFEDFNFINEVRWLILPGTICFCDLLEGSLTRALLTGVVVVLLALRLARWRCWSLQRPPRGQDPVLVKSGHTRVCFFLHWRLERGRQKHRGTGFNCNSFHKETQVSWYCYRTLLCVDLVQFFVNTCVLWHWLFWLWQRYKQEMWEHPFQSWNL